MASEYGWAYQTILSEVYPEDFFLLSRQIRIRRIDNTLTQIMVANTPNSEDRDFVDSLIKTQRFMRGEVERPPIIDRQGVEQLKNAMRGSKSIKVKGYN